MAVHSSNIYEHLLPSKVIQQRHSLVQFNEEVTNYCTLATSPTS